MKLVVRVRVFYLALALMMAFAPVAILTPTYALYLMLGCVLLTTSATVVWQYWPVVNRATWVRIKYIDRVELLAFAIVLLFAGTAIREGYVTIWREFFPIEISRPDEFFYPLAFIRYTCIVASVTALIARDMIVDTQGSRMPGWPAAILSTLAGLALGTFMVYRQL